MVSSVQQGCPTGGARGRSRSIEGKLEKAAIEVRVEEEVWASWILGRVTSTASKA